MRSLLRSILALLSILNLVVCERQSGEAVARGIEHIAAAIKVATPRSGPTTAEAAIDSQGDDDITVDSYVMERVVRGTGREPRALT